MTAKEVSRMILKAFKCNFCCKQSQFKENARSKKPLLLNFAFQNDLLRIFGDQNGFHTNKVLQYPLFVTIYLLLS